MNCKKLMKNKQRRASLEFWRAKRKLTTTTTVVNVANCITDCNNGKEQLETLPVDTIIGQDGGLMTSIAFLGEEVRTEAAGAFENHNGDINNS